MTPTREPSARRTGAEQESTTRAPWSPRLAQVEFLRTFVRRHLPVITAWPVMALLLGGLLWIVINSLLDREREDVERESMKQATSLARGYAQQMTRTVEHMDQITLNIRYAWEETKKPPNLEHQRERGLYPPGQKMYASIIGRDGAIVTSSFPADRAYNFSDSPNQRMHRTDPRRDLVISGPGMSRRLGRPIVLFSRRLEDAQGNFDGVALMAVESSYLSAFQDESLLGRNDFVSIRYLDGPVLVTKIGQRPGEVTVFYRKDPVFQGAAGVMLEPGEKFRDGVARFVAWQKLDHYPLVALAALSVEESLAAYSTTARNYRALALVGSVLLIFLGAVGAFYSARLAWRRLQEDEIRQTYRLAVDTAREGFYMLRPVYDRHYNTTDFIAEDCNERGAEMLGMTKETLIGKKFSELYSGEYRDSHMEKLRRGLELGFYEDELRASPHSMLQPKWVHRRLVRSGGALALTLRDISEAKEHERQLTNMANADVLTALPNRNWLINYLPLAITRARNNGAGLAVLFIDLDDFKNVNDTLGHAAGDELLKSAAVRIRAQVRGSDHVIRLGGDEFTVVIEDVVRVEDVSRVADQVVKALEEPFTLGRASGNRIHGSIGISMYPRDGEDGESLLKHADVAMYAAKTAGKGRCYFYHPQMSDRLVLRLSREQALREAIERDEFVLHYQPRVDAATGRLCSMEALVRWMHPERGIVHPLEFIVVAEDTGLIIALGGSVIEKVCAQIAQWKAAGLPVVPVSINVSALQFNQGKVRDALEACIRRHGLESSLIGIELTESCMAGDDDIVSAELEGLRSLGVKLLVDDFGTGYSSLSQLQRMNVDVLKVDRAFTLGLDTGAEGKALFKAIVSMAEALSISIVAEGVETPEQLGLLQSLDCDEVQGYLVSKPVTADEVSRLMEKRFLFPPAVERGKKVPI